MLTFSTFSATTSEQSFDESKLPIFLSEDEHINSEVISYIRSNSEVINHICRQQNISKNICQCRVNCYILLFVEAEAISIGMRPMCEGKIKKNFKEN